MLRYVKNGMLLLSVAYIVIGMLLLIMPETSLLWICNIFGCCGAYHRHCLPDPVCPYPRHRLYRAVHAGGRRHHGGAGHLHAGKAAGSDQLSAHCVRHLHRR